MRSLLVRLATLGTVVALVVGCDQRSITTAVPGGPGGGTGTGGGSGSTGAKPLEADIVYFPTLADLQAAPAGSLTGKIAFINHAMTATQDGSHYGPFGQVRRQGHNLAAR